MKQTKVQFSLNLFFFQNATLLCKAHFQNSYSYIYNMIILKSGTASLSKRMVNRML